MGFSANPLSQANAVVSPPPGSATAASPPPATSCFPVTLGSGLYHTRGSCCTRGWTLGASAPSATGLVREPAGQALTQTLHPPIQAESKSTPFWTQMNHVLRPDKPRNKRPHTHFTEGANQPAQQEHQAQVGSDTRWWAPARWHLLLPPWAWAEPVAPCRVKPCPITETSALCLLPEDRDPMVPVN